MKYEEVCSVFIFLYSSSSSLLPSSVLFSLSFVRWYEKSRAHFFFHEMQAKLLFPIFPYGRTRGIKQQPSEHIQMLWMIKERVFRCRRAANVLSNNGYSNNNIALTRKRYAIIVVSYQDSIRRKTYPPDYALISLRLATVEQAFSQQYYMLLYIFQYRSCTVIYRTISLEICVSIQENFDSLLRRSLSYLAKLLTFKRDQIFHQWHPPKSSTTNLYKFIIHLNKVLSLTRILNWIYNLRS